jgi:D-serine dehydratase
MTEVLDKAAKGWPSAWWGQPVGSIGDANLNIGRGDLPLPVLTLSGEAVDHNITVMTRWCKAHGVSLAPHLKTSLAPDLIRRQMKADAWGATVSNARQAHVAVKAGAQRLLVANEIVDRHDLDLLLALQRDGRAAVTVFVDSPEGLAVLEAAASRFGLRIDVLIEIGTPGVRTGVRDLTGFLGLLDRVTNSGHVDLAGVSSFEGVLVRASNPQAPDPMRDFVWRVGDMVEEALDCDQLQPGTLFSAGGSIGFDLVAERFGNLGLSIVLRSGCYLTHDHGLYQRASPLSKGRPYGAVPDSLMPALELWAHVISIPEPGIAIASFGRRDANEEAGRPLPLAVVDPPGDRRPISGWVVDRMWDQHARLVAASDPSSLEVADVVVFGISHPCTVMDKWRWIPEIDRDLNVVSAVGTWF